MTVVLGKRGDYRIKPGMKIETSALEEATYTQIRNDFWTGAAETMMVDEFIDDWSDAINKRYGKGKKE